MKKIIIAHLTVELKEDMEAVETARRPIVSI